MLRGLSIGVAVLLLLLTFPAPAQRAVEEINDPEQLFAYAAGLQQRHYFDLAEAQLQTFLRKFPEHARAREVHFLLIDALKRQQKTAQVLDELALFRKKWPAADEIARLELLEATLNFDRRDFARAADTYRKLLHTNDPTIAEQAAYDLARCLLELKQESEALSLLAEIAAREFSPDFPKRYYAAFQTAVELARKNELEPASALFQRLCVAPGVPPELRLQALALSAELARASQRYDEALQFYNQILAENPGEAAARQARRQRLFTFYDKKEFSRVCELAADFRERYPEADDYEVILVYATSLSECQRHGEALQFYQSAVDDPRLSPGNHQYARVQFLRTLQKLGRDQAALEAARQFLTDFPNTSEKGEILHLIGETCRKLNQPEEAIESYRQALEAYIGEPLRVMLVGDALWRYLYELKRFSEAARVCRRLAKQVPEKERAHYRLQAALLSQTAAEDALVHEDLQAVLTDWPNVAAIRRQALEIYVNFTENREDYQTATRYLTLLRNEAPTEEFDRWSARLASALMAQQQVEQAVVVLAEALQKPATNPRARHLCQLILLRLHLLMQAGDAVIIPLAEETLTWLPDFLSDTQEKTPTIYAAELLALGKIFLRAGRLAPAGRFLELALACPQLQREELSEGLGLQAEILQRAGKVDESVEFLQRGLQEHAAVLGNSQSLLSRLGEAALQLKRYPLAFDAVERALRSEVDVVLESEVRSRYVMARLLFESDHNYTEAMGYALKCFIVSDHPVYSPRAMELAVEIALARKNREEALVTWNELKQRYPWYVPAVKEP